MSDLQRYDGNGIELSKICDICPDLKSYELEFLVNTISGKPYCLGCFGFTAFDGMNFRIDCDDYPVWTVTITEAYSGSEVACSFDFNLTSAFRRAQLGAVLWDLESGLSTFEAGSIFETQKF
jgi:hypothetical protein